MILAHEKKKYKSLSQGRDGSGPVVSSEDGTAGDEEGRTGVFDGLDGLGIDAAIDFDDSRRIASLFQEGFRLADLIDGIGDELLAAKARVDAHDENHVQLSGQAGQGRYGSRRIQGDAAFHAGFVDLLQDPVEMGAGFLMDRDVLDTGVSQAIDIGFRMFDHEVGIKRQFCAAAQGFDDGDAEGQVGYEMAVHQVEMDTIGSLLFNILNFFSQAGEVRR
jgi:hypothetical protein